jgi:UDP-N-acetyl-D-galactosamine dehydrogenase
MSASSTVAIVGLGYVGLPLAVAFGRQRPTIGFDLSKDKVAAYREGRDPTGEVAEESFRQAKQLQCSTDAAELKKADYVIVSVPTPVDGVRTPDFAPLRAARYS